MSYQPNKPLAGDRISQSQVDLETNFQQLNIGFGVDHNAYDAANAGQHKKVLFTTTQADPVIANPAGQLYTKSVSGTIQAFFSNGTTVSQLTGLPEDVVGEGTITLAAGLTIKWGTRNVAVVDDVKFNYPVAFSTAVFAVVVTPVRNNTGEKSFYLLALPGSGGDNDKVGFKLRSDFNGWSGFSYIAIGN